MTTRTRCDEAMLIAETAVYRDYKVVNTQCGRHRYETFYVGARAVPFMAFLVDSHETAPSVDLPHLLHPCGRRCKAVLEWLVRNGHAVVNVGTGSRLIRTSAGLRWAMFTY